MRKFYNSGKLVKDMKIKAKGFQTLDVLVANTGDTLEWIEETHSKTEYGGIKIRVAVTDARARSNRKFWTFFKNFKEVSQGGMEITEKRKHARVWDSHEHIANFKVFFSK